MGPSRGRAQTSQKLTIQTLSWTGEWIVLLLQGSC